jgi:hypothetical protein
VSLIITFLSTDIPQIERHTFHIATVLRSYQPYWVRCGGSGAVIEPMKMLRDARTAAMRKLRRNAKA